MVTIFKVKTTYMFVKKVNYQLSISDGIIRVTYEKEKDAKNAYLMKYETLRRTDEDKNLSYDGYFLVTQLFPGLGEEHLVESFKSELDNIKAKSGKMIKLNYEII